MKKEDLIPPKKDSTNRIHEYFADIAKSITGGLVNPLVDFVLPSFHQKRFEEWCNNVFEALTELSDKRYSVEELQNNEEFISLLKESMVIASKTHQTEKHELLKRALMNQFDTSSSFDEKLLFTRLIDSLTISHIYLLYLLKKYCDSFKGFNDFSEVVNILKEDKASNCIPSNAYNILFGDLVSHNLIENDLTLRFEMSLNSSDLTKDMDSHIYQISEFGKDFIDYIMKE